MYKILLPIIISSFSLPSFAALREIDCNGARYLPNAGETIAGKVVAKVDSNKELSDVSFETVDVTTKSTLSRGFLASVEATEGYSSSKAEYANFNKFELSPGGWSELQLLLPKMLPSHGPFGGYLIITGHDYMPTLILRCE